MRLALSAAVVVLFSATGITRASTVTYRLDPAASTVHVLTGSSGLLGFVGHEHTIAVPSFTGEAAIDSTDITRFELTIVAQADSLRVVDEDEDQDTRRKIEKDMREDVLETAKFPTFTLRGVRFVPGGSGSGFGTHEGTLSLAIQLHGVERTVETPLLIELGRDQLKARGKFSIKHSDFDMHRKKVAGVVNVAQKLVIEYDVTGRAVAVKDTQ